MIKSVLCIPDSASGTNGETQVVYFDGIAYTDDGFLVSPVGEYKSSEIKNSEGEWALIERDKDGLTLYTDIYGYYTIFYAILSSDRGKVLALSADFSSICSVVNSNKKFEADKSYCLPMLASFSPFFNTSHSLNTSHLYVKKLAPLKKIRIGNGAISIVEDTRLNQYESLSYDDLLSAGINSISKKYRSFIENDYDLVFYLSGGKDSRACLSAYDSNISGYFYSQNPSSYSGESKFMLQADYNISAHLAEKVGLSRYIQDGAPLKSVGYDEHFKHVSKLNSNKTNMYGPSIFSSNAERFRKSIQIRGGGGEVLRSYWTDYLSKTGISDSFVGANGYGNWKDFTFLFNKLVSRSLVRGEGLYKEIQNSFINELLSMNKNTANETLEEHYFLHRNRYHFGHLRSSLLAGNICYMPLSNKFLLLASRKLSFSSRAQGKLLHDIILRSEYALDKVEYEAGGWPWENNDANQKRYHVPKKEVNSDFYKPSKISHGSSLPFFSKVDFLKSKFFSVSEEVRDNESFSFIGDDLYKFLSVKVENGDKSSPQVIQKLSSVLDAASFHSVNVVWLY